MKKLSLLVAVMSMCLLTTGCNRQLFDATYKFDKAVLIVGGEVIEVDVSSWKDFDDGDQIQIKTTDGTTYLVHASNCTLIEE